MNIFKRRIRFNWLMLFSANFLGIFNDNFLKYMIIYIGATWVLPSWLTQAQLLACISGALILPYLILSPLAGKMSILRQKQRVLNFFKFLEIPVLVLAAMSFYWQSITLAIGCVLFMGVLSCLYSPAKYSLIKDIGGESRVPFGSSMIEATSFSGVLIGTIVASFIADHYNFPTVSAVLIGLALLGYFSSKMLRVKESAIDHTLSSTANPFRFLKENFKFLIDYPFIRKGIINYSIFWLLGGVLQMNVVLHCTHYLQCSYSITGIVTSMSAIGVIFGCLLAGSFLKKSDPIKISIIGAIGLIACFCTIIFGRLPVIVFGLLILLVAFFGGLFQVASLVLVQREDIGRKMGDVMAFLNWVTFFFVLVGTAAFSVITIIWKDSSIAVFVMLLIVSIYPLVTLLMTNKKRNNG